MWWNTAIILIWLCIFFTIVAVTIVCQKKKTGIAKPISIIFAGMLLAVYIGIFPGNYVSANYSDNDFIRTGCSPDMYEEDTGLFHKTIEFEKERMR